MFTLNIFSIYHKTYFFQDDVVIKKTVFLSGAISILQGKRDKIISFFGIPFFKYKDREYRKISILGIPIFKKKLLNNFIEKLNDYILSDYDAIFLCRHNIGESFIYLSYLNTWISKTNSKKPAILVWRKNDIPFYKMFIDDSVEIVYAPLTQFDLNLFLKESKYLVSGIPLYSPTYNIAKNLIKSYKKNRKTNFISFILNDLDIELPKIASNKIKIPKESFIRAKYDVNLNLGNTPYVLICPEAKSLSTISLDFWSPLIQILNKKGYAVILNSLSKETNSLNVQHTISCSIDELCAYVKLASGVISMASGLGLLLSSLGVSCDLIYTSYKDKKIGFSSILVQEIYSVRHLKDYCGIDVSKTREWNTATMDLHSILNCILDRY